MQSFDPLALKTCKLQLYVKIFETASFRRVRQSFIFDFGGQVVPNEDFLYSLHFFN